MERGTLRSVVRAGIALAATLLAGCATQPEQADMRGPQAPSKPRIYVANESSNSVTVLDSGGFTVIGTVETGSESTHDIALSRDGRSLFATNLASGRLTVIDTQTLETVASIPTGSRCHVVALTNDNKQAWVANIAEDNVSVVDTGTFRVLGTIPVGKGPTGLTFSRDGRFAYVSNQGDRTVAIVETVSHRIVKSIPVGADPHFLVLGPNGLVWGTNTGGNDIYIIDPATQEKIASLEVGPNPQQIAFAYKGMVGPNAYVTVGGGNKVVVVGADPRRLEILGEIPVGEGPNGIAANPEGTRVYVGHEQSNDLRVIDTGTSKVVATSPVGRKPIRVVVAR